MPPVIWLFDTVEWIWLVDQNNSKKFGMPFVNKISFKCTLNPIQGEVSRVIKKLSMIPGSENSWMTTDKFDIFMTDDSSFDRCQIWHLKP